MSRPRRISRTRCLKVVACSNPADAYWMIQQAVASDDPIIFEPKRRYHEKAEVDEAAPPLPLHAARVARTGSDVTLVAYGPMVRTFGSAAEAAAQEGRDLEVIDLRSLSPRHGGGRRLSPENRSSGHGARGAGEPGARG